MDEPREPINTPMFERDCTNVYIAIVAIPPDFDINLYMSPGEQAGFFKFESADAEKIRIISESVKNTPILKLSGVQFERDSIMQFFQIIKDIGLMVDSVAFQAEINHFLIDLFKNMIAKFGEKGVKNLGVTNKRLNESVTSMQLIDSFAVVNLFPFHLKDSLRPYIEKVVEVEDWRKEKSE